MQTRTFIIFIFRVQVYCSVPEIQNVYSQDLGSGPKSDDDFILEYPCVQNSSKSKAKILDSPKCLLQASMMGFRC